MYIVYTFYSISLKLCNILNKKGPGRAFWSVANEVDQVNLIIDMFICEYFYVEWVYM